VVLSACDTGRGRITGDGVVGLTRAFLSAGADTVIVSLWQVPDDATAALMVAFYEALAETDDKAAALQQAMVATRAQFPDPRNWSAFVLVGMAM
jgi:CHAT domain-containing protein